MKFDITRAWKDETYRESLSNEQLDTLPSNPAGELSDSELEAAFGGWGGGGHGGIVYNKQYEHSESVSLICEVNVFSISLLASNIAILGHVTQVCIKG